MPRPKGARNARPSRKEVAGYYEMLRSAAKGGDTGAAAKLIELDMKQRSTAQ